MVWAMVFLFAFLRLFMSATVAAMEARAKFDLHL